MISRLFGLLFLLFASINVQAAPIADWTMLVYMNGFNNLDPFGTMNLNSMEAAGSTDKVNIVVQYGSLKTKKARRYVVQKDTNMDVVTSPSEEVASSERDMGDFRNAISFFAWGIKNYPAKKYIIDVWNHGSGFHRKRVPGEFSIQDISFDDISGHAISTKELGIVMEEASKEAGHKIEVYVSDACLMGSIEVASEMENSVSYFVGSEDLIPGLGINYESFLSELVKNPDMDGKELGMLILTSYMELYPTQDVTMSVLDLSKLDEVMLQTKYAVNKIKTIPNLLPYKKALVASQKFAYKDYGDFLSFLNATPIQFDALKSSLNELIIGSAQNGFPGAYGVSVWLPSKALYNQHSSKYEQLIWEKETDWSSLIRLLAE